MLLLARLTQSYKVKWRPSIHNELALPHILTVYIYNPGWRGVLLAYIITSLSSSHIIQVIAITGQGWVNSVLFIFMSPEIRTRMFVYPFSRHAINNVTVIRDSNDSASDPLLGVTEITHSTRARVRQEDDTYYSIPTEFPS